MLRAVQSRVVQDSPQPASTPWAAARVAHEPADTYERSVGRRAGELPTELWGVTARFCDLPTLVRLTTVSRSHAAAARCELETRYQPPVVQRAQALRLRYEASKERRERLFEHWYAQRVRIAESVLAVRGLGRVRAPYGLPKCLRPFRRQTDVLLHFRGECSDGRIFRLRRELAGVRLNFYAAHGVPQGGSAKAMAPVDRAWHELFCAIDGVCNAVQSLHEAALEEATAQASHRVFLATLG